MSTILVIAISTLCAMGGFAFALSFAGKRRRYDYVQLMTIMSRELHKTEEMSHDWLIINSLMTRASNIHHNLRP